MYKGMKEIYQKLLLGIFIASSINACIAMETQLVQHNKDLEYKQNEEQQDRLYFNYSLLNIIPAMKSFGYKVKLVNVNAEITDDNGDPIIENGEIKKEVRSAIKFSKDGIHMATFPIDKIVPSEHNLYEWAGCPATYESIGLDTQVDWCDIKSKEEYLKKEFYITLCGLYNSKYEDKVRMMTDIVDDSYSGKYALFDTENYLSKTIKLFKRLLSYPEGKMLIYSIFLNQSFYYFCKKSEYLSGTISNIGNIFQNFFKSIRDKDQCIDVKSVVKTNLMEYFENMYDDSEENENKGKRDSCKISFNTKNFTIYNKDKKIIEIDGRTVFVPDKSYDSDDNKIQINYTNNVVVDLFHELCHFLNESGENWHHYCEEYAPNLLNRKINDHEGTGLLIVKYWEEMYGKRKTYSKNLIHLLFNDLLRYIANSCIIGSIFEVLPTNWSNLGKNYYGNHLYENLLRYRIQGRIRDSHDILHNHNDLQKSHLLNTLNEDYDYEKFIEARIRMQQDHFEGKNVITKKKPINITFNESVSPFILEYNTLKINAPGNSYSIYKPLLISNLNYFENLVKTKPDDQSVIDLMFVLHAHDIIDRDGYEETGKPKMEYTKEELIELVDKVLVAHLGILKRYNKLCNEIEKVDRDIKKLETINKVNNDTKKLFNVKELDLEKIKELKAESDLWFREYQEDKNCIKKGYDIKKELEDDIEELEWLIRNVDLYTFKDEEERKTGLNNVKNRLNKREIGLENVKKSISHYELEKEKDFEKWQKAAEKLKKLTELNNNDLIKMLKNERNSICEKIDSELMKGARHYLNKIKHENINSMNIRRENFEHRKDINKK